MNDFFKKILDDLPSGVWVTDGDDRVVYINKAMTEIAGASVEKFVGLYVFKELDKPGNKEFLDSYRKVKKNLFPGEYEVRLKDSQGKGFVHRGWLTPQIKDGQYDGMIVTAEDITEKDIFEVALKDSEEKFRRTIEFAADGILLGTHDGFIFEANHAACELFGMSKREVLSLHISKMPFTRESLERSPMRFDLLKEGETVISERVIRRKDGSEIIIEMKTKMMEDGTYQSIYRDITGRKRIEAELKKNEEKYSRLVHNINDGIGIVDKNENFIFANDSAERIFEVEQGGLNKRSLWDFIPDENKNKILSETSKRQSGESTRYELEIITAKGTEKTIQVAASPDYDEKGNVTATYGVFFDITEKKRAENEIKRINESLEQKVKERTAQLETVNKELESFSYSVSHDLRAPVRHISGFTDILKKSLGNEPDQISASALEKIKKAAEKMERLIDDLLEFSKTGRIEISKNKTDMVSLIEPVKKDICDNLSDRRIAWRIEKLPFVNCDRNLLKIVWENLISNSCKYTAGKDAFIEIGFNEKGKEYEFFIKDNGIGFDPEFCGKLFGVFQRLHLEKDFPGTGIGLATVRRIVNRHGGSVRAESEGEGKGACFYFTLPKNGGENGR
jgi:PAS domain S-box-containing protein